MISGKIEHGNTSVKKGSILLSFLLLRFILFGGADLSCPDPAGYLLYFSAGKFYPAGSGEFSTAVDNMYLVFYR